MTASEDRSGKKLAKISVDECSDSFVNELFYAVRSGRPLKKGTGSRLRFKHLAILRCSEGACPPFQHLFENLAAWREIQGFAGDSSAGANPAAVIPSDLASRRLARRPVVSRMATMASTQQTMTSTRQAPPQPGT